MEKRNFIKTLITKTDIVPLMNEDTTPYLNETNHIPIHKSLYNTENNLYLEMDTGLSDYKNYKIYKIYNNVWAMIYATIGLTGLGMSIYSLTKDLIHFGFTIPALFFLYSAFANANIKDNSRLINVAILIRTETLKYLDDSGEITDIKREKINTCLIADLQKEINSYFSFSWILCLQRKQKVVFIEDTNTRSIYAIIQMYSKSESKSIDIDMQYQNHLPHKDYKKRKYIPILRQESIQNSYINQGKTSSPCDALILYYEQ